MDYKDYTDPNTGERYINGKYIGIVEGTKLRDSLDLQNDGFNHLRNVKHFGTLTQDKLQSNKE
ncbi:MAG: hypothetical protein E6929_07760 [Clostridium sp.]|nr:hypothetical protein [Clostridium sp.]